MLAGQLVRRLLNDALNDLTPSQPATRGAVTVRSPVRFKVLEKLLHDEAVVGVTFKRIDGLLDCEPIVRR